MPDLELIPEASALEALFSSKEPAAVLDAILGSTPCGAIAVRASDGKILGVSDYAARLLGVPRSEVEGHFVTDALEHTPIYDMSGRRLPPHERPEARALLGETVTGFELSVEAADGERISILVSATPVHNTRGEIIGAISSFADLKPYKALERSLREAVAQREALYQELTHRVKNHLQILSALVALESRNPARSTKDLGEQIQGKLQALAAVYRSMDRAEVGARIEARKFLEEVCLPYASGAVSVEAEVAPPDVTLASEQAGPVGMLVNEAVANSRKHAFPNHHGRIQVSLRRQELGRLRLEVADDGVGWGPVGPSETSHGLDLMRMFAKQLHGELELRAQPRGGTLVATDIPEAVQ
jgi:PAS domain S-box-containing protein